MAHLSILAECWLALPCFSEYQGARLPAGGLVSTISAVRLPRHLIRSCPPSIACLLSLIHDACYMKAFTSNFAGRSSMFASSTLGSARLHLPLHKVPAARSTCTGTGSCTCYPTGSGLSIRLGRAAWPTGMMYFAANLAS